MHEDGLDTSQGGRGGHQEVPECWLQDGGRDPGGED